MATPECKQIEKCIKDIIFKSLAPEEPIGMNRTLNHNTFSIDDRCLVSNIENTPNPPNVKILHPPGTSELIDFNVLSNFARKHIADASLNNTRLALNNTEVVLPHPDLEDTSVDLNNGEALSMGREGPPGISDLLHTISKEIKNSPNFLSMPENPLPQGTKEKKTPPPKKNQRSARGQKKQKKKKERMDGLYIAKEEEEEEAVVKVVVAKESGNKETPIKKEDIPTIAKRPAVGEAIEEQCIKMKKNPFTEITQEYCVLFQEGKYKFQCCLCAYTHDVEDTIIKHVNSKNHRTLKSQGDLDMLLPFLPDPMPQQTEAITELLNKIIESEGLSKELIEKRINLTLKLQKFVKENLPMCNVELIGSSAYGCALKSTEVDLAIRIASDDNLPECLEKLYLLMKDKGKGKSLRCSWIGSGKNVRWRKGDTFEKVLNEFQQKRPCIKYTDRETSLPCNILIDSSSSLKLANILATYFKLDERAIKLGIAVRHWAKICALDQQENGTFPSFCHPLMVVHFLQQVQPPVLPVLNEVKDYSSTPEFYAEYLEANQWKSHNVDTLGELWLKFFHFYNFDYKLGSHVVCIRNSKRVTCKERNWSTRFYAIEDPFLRRNLAYVIPTYQVCYYIEQCYLRTYRYFAYPQLKSGVIKITKTDSFDALKLSEYINSKPAPRKEDLEESEDSGNEDYDVSQDLEDHDPDVPLTDFITTMSNISISETKEEKKEKSSESGSSSPIKPCEKAAKDNSNKSSLNSNADALCYWDLKGLDLKKVCFNYEFRPVTFKGDKPFPLTCKACKTSGHRKKDCPVDVLPKPEPLPKMTPEFLKIVNDVLYSIRDQFVVSKAELNYIDADMRNVQAYIREVFPDASLKLFGSFCNGFGFRNQSDMDFCLTFGDRNDGKDLDSALVIEKIAKELCRHEELMNVLPIKSAKVPIVKFTWRETGLEGDISLYNTLALVNTELLEAYSRIDSRVQVLGYAFKHFAKVLGICDASRGSLSSYAYILMVIFFLQQRNPPVIPVLQELHSDDKPVRLIDNWNVWFYRDIYKLDQVWPEFGKNKESVGELWQGLLNFYTCDFNWKEYVISIKQKSPLTRFRKLWISNQLAIEDPFDLNHNLGGGLSGKMNTYIMKSFIRARERFGTPVSFDKQKPGSEQAFLFNRSFLNSGVEPPQDRGCSNCGKIGHIARNCPQEKACSYCRQTGHLIKNCPRKGRGGKKTRERDRNFPLDKQNQDRRPNPDKRAQNQSLKAEFSLNRTYPGMQHPPNPMEGQKLLQMGIPTHRLPPPGFPARNMLPSTQNPPPGFNGGNNGGFFQPGSYPPPFSIKPSYPPPFSRQNELATSPPKNYPPKAPFVAPNQQWRQEFNVQRHPAPPMPRGMVPRNPPLPRNGGRNARNHGNQWQGRPLVQRDHFPNSNLDHRLHRSNSDASAYNSNNDGRW